jgi:hypothetical protein
MVPREGAQKVWSEYPRSAGGLGENPRNERLQLKELSAVLIRECEDPSDPASQPPSQQQQPPPPQQQQQPKRQASGQGRLWNSRNLISWPPRPRPPAQTRLSTPRDPAPPHAPDRPQPPRTLHRPPPDESAHSCWRAAPPSKIPEV